MTKGEKIVFSGGKFIGRTGWLDDEMNANNESTRIYVYVQRSNGKTVRTYVYDDAIAKPKPPPTNRVEAIQKYLPKTDRKLTNACDDFIRGGMEEGDLKHFLVAVKIRFRERLAKFQAKGDEALVRNLKWDDPNKVADAIFGVDGDSRLSKMSAMSNMSAITSKASSKRG